MLSPVTVKSACKFFVLKTLTSIRSRGTLETPMLMFSSCLLLQIGDFLTASTMFANLSKKCKYFVNSVLNFVCKCPTCICYTQLKNLLMNGFRSSSFLTAFVSAASLKLFLIILSIYWAIFSYHLQISVELNFYEIVFCTTVNCKLRTGYAEISLMSCNGLLYYLPKVNSLQI